ncbi:MAG: aldolase [Alphaproteobacteria bacterium]|nr:MAG: aldolase [Alphaproteobacteria bacterium]
MSLIRVHASCVTFGATGVLIRGASGAGKSDLALRVIHLGGRLVADDQVYLQAQDGVLYAFAPHVLRGRLEVRGVGIVELPYAHVSALGCIIDLIDGRNIDRMPEPMKVELAGLRIACHRLDPFEAAAPHKVAAIARLCHNPFTGRVRAPIDR